MATLTMPVDAMKRAKGWLLDIFTHNHAEQLRIGREVQRKKLGLPPGDPPYPGSTTGSNNPVTNINKATGFVQGAILGVALLTGGAAVGRLATLPAPIAAPAEKPAQSEGVSPPAPEKHWDAVTEESDDGGKTWKPVRRERLK